ncbi:MAGE homology domain-containing protein, partial [Spinellus fusiger]
ELSRKVKDTVRYCLACEYKGTPIRREDITKKILQEHGKEYKRVQSMANTKLRELFGMEMVELPVRDKGPSTHRKEKAVVVSRGYVLRNLLPEAYNAPDLIHISDKEYATTGLVYVVLALIFVSEQTLSNGELLELAEHLDRLCVREETHAFGDRDKLIEGYVKQGYLARHKIGNAGPSDTDTAADLQYEYTWGPRAKVEIPEENMVNFIASLYELQETGLEELTNYIYKAAGFSAP